MKGLMKRFTLLAATIASAALLLSGCSGDDGKNGAAGTPGTSVTLTDESCVVCHSASDEADQVAAHAYIYNSATDTRFLKTRYNETWLTVDTITLASEAVTDRPVVTFRVKNGSTLVTGLTASDVRVYIGTIVPKGTATDRGTFGSDHIETWGYASGYDTATYPSNTDYFVASSFVDNGNGTYSAKLNVAMGTAAVSQAATSTSNPTGLTTYRNANYSPSLKQRVYIRVTPTTTALGTTVVNVGNGAGLRDFTLGGIGAAAVADANLNNQIAITASCKKCHGAPMIAAAHGSSYGGEVQACVMCHTPLHYHAEAAEINLTKFIHEIHAAKPVDAFPTRIFGHGYEDVTYPRPLTDCNACHSSTTAATGGEKWKTNPSINACSSCHEDYVTVQPVHVGLLDASCSICHTATLISTQHTPEVATKDVPEYVATMTIEPPANESYYVAGETPTVTVTLKDKLTDAAVPAALYTNAKHSAGSTVADSLATARLYVYGPRADAKPVLTKAAVTLSTAGIPTQRQDLFVNAADPQILTDGTGFKYKLTAIPADMTAGTYMIRFTAQNYGYVSDANYKIDTTAFRTIQIGTATEEKRISGDTCVDCHGSGNFVGHNARHSATFKPDECISCHDKSGNHADPLDNRIHAIHSASATGDKLYDPIEEPLLTWAHVTYPQGLRSADTATVKAAGAPRCVGCHTQTSGTGLLWKTSISKDSCVGCHADKPGSNDHYLQNGAR